MIIHVHLPPDTLLQNNYNIYNSNKKTFDLLRAVPLAAHTRILKTFNKSFEILRVT